MMLFGELFGEGGVENSKVADFWFGWGGYEVKVVFKFFWIIIIFAIEFSFEWIFFDITTTW